MKSSTINKRFGIGCMIISVCLLLSLWGCKDEPPPLPPKPAVVKQKINLTEAAPSPKTAVADAQVAKPKDLPTVSAQQKPTDMIQQAKSETAKKAVTAIEPMSSLKTSITDTSRRYDPEGKIDPFDPLIKDKVSGFGNTGSGKPQRPLTPLEKIDLSQLKLVGVIRAGSGNKAMVEDATGKGYIVTKGTRIGVHSGEVSKIERDRLHVQEMSEDIFGRPKESQKELKLQKPPGEE